MNYYELTYLLNPNLDEPKSVMKDISQLIQDQGTLDAKSDLEQIELGSSIKPKLGKENLSEVLIGTIDFYIEPKETNKLREKIAQNKEVLRIMLVNKEEQPAEIEIETETEKEKKVELEDIDQKLDEILEE